MLRCEQAQGCFSTNRMMTLHSMPMCPNHTCASDRARTCKHKESHMIFHLHCTLKADQFKGCRLSFSSQHLSMKYMHYRRSIGMVTRACSAFTMLPRRSTASGVQCCARTFSSALRYACINKSDVWHASHMALYSLKCPRCTYQHMLTVIPRHISVAGQCRCRCRVDHKCLKSPGSIVDCSENCCDRRCYAMH